MSKHGRYSSQQEAQELPYLKLEDTMSIKRVFVHKRKMNLHNEEERKAQEDAKAAKVLAQEEQKKSRRNRWTKTRNRYYLSD